MILSTGKSWAAFGEDLEKPEPTFTREGADWVAKLIPRGKSTHIQIRFHAEGAEIEQIASKEYPEDHAPLVNWKNFRSDFFAVKMRLSSPGVEIPLSVSSNYFTTATDLWGPVSVNNRKWETTHPMNVGLADRTKVLTVTLRDGGPLDADGKTNERIEFICGPRDSFWGYAIGTLLIRYFGIFIVLTVLMIGMLVSGKVFQWLEKRHQQKESQIASAATSSEIPDTSEEAHGVDPGTVAAIAVALHLQRNASPQKPFSDLSPPPKAPAGAGSEEVS